ncbi:MAG: Gfo/Idh/MocA family oxidoreductase [Methanomassiliicoccales archaeon]|jgi:UDP-N-acetylglucosamine 3-dehydrogenase|nr:Gfo/Idh/MocA family oxidoreductase [Methanomassiliicoccales archaeon]
MIRTGVIGVGYMGQNHARIYSEISELVGIYDVDTEHSRAVARRFGTQAFEKIDDLIRRAEALSICAPTAEHFHLALMAIKAGKSVLLEKPFTGDSKKASLLANEAEKQSIVLAGGFVERFNPVVSAAKEALEVGRFGKLISISSRRVSSFPSRIRDVGVIMDLAIHDIDVIRYITSSEISEVFGMGGKFANDKFEDYVNLLLELECGVTGHVETNWLTPMKVRKVSMTCSKGYVQLDYIDQVLEVSSSEIKEIDPGNLFQVPLEFDVRRISLKKEEPLKRELQDFLAAVRSSGKPAVRAEDAIMDLKVCEAAIQSVREKRKIEIAH